MIRLLKALMVTIVVSITLAMLPFCSLKPMHTTSALWIY
tara:strand:+ start:92012 stop:92128 length:117 start_codon:yes stop_codon:yes gene_type:complete